MTEHFNEQTPFLTYSAKYPASSIQKPANTQYSLFNFPPPLREACPPSLSLRRVGRAIWHFQFLQEIENTNNRNHENPVNPV